MGYPLLRSTINMFILTSEFSRIIVRIAANLEIHFAYLLVAAFLYLFSQRFLSRLAAEITL